MTKNSARNIRVRPLTWLLLVVGVVFVVLAVVYFVDTASSLPSWLPGHQRGVTHHHIKHGLAAIALAVLAWIGAWFSTAPTA